MASKKMICMLVLVMVVLVAYMSSSANAEGEEIGRKLEAGAEEQELWYKKGYHGGHPWKKAPYKKGGYHHKGGYSKGKGGAGYGHGKGKGDHPGHPH